MSELRLILIAAGVALIVLVYFLSRRSDKRKVDPATGLRREPVLRPPEVTPAASGQRGQTDEPDVGQPAAAPVTDTRYEQADLPLPEELRPDTDTAPGRPDSGKGERTAEKVIVMHVAARGNARFAGPDIVEALRAENLVFGEFNIFHRRESGQSLFHVASMVEPGQFDLDNIETFSTPGLSLFLVLPGPNSPIAAFTEMLATARRLAVNLGGEVRDEKGSTMSRQAASHLREQIIEFAHRLR